MPLVPPLRWLVMPGIGVPGWGEWCDGSPGTFMGAWSYPGDGGKAATFCQYQGTIETIYCRFVGILWPIEIHIIQLLSGIFHHFHSFHRSLCWNQRDVTRFPAAQAQRPVPTKPARKVIWRQQRIEAKPNGAPFDKHGIHCQKECVLDS